MRRHGTKTENVRESLVFYKRETPADPPASGDYCAGNCTCPDQALNESSTAAYYVATA